MNEVVHLRQIIQVKKQRANSYTTVDLINADGSIKKRDKTTVVKFPEHAKDTATAVSLWEVSGKERLNHFKINDFPLSEYTIDAANINFPSEHSLLFDDGFQRDLFSKALSTTYHPLNILIGLFSF